MHQNIKNNNIKKLDAKLYNEKYYDYMLYKGETAYQDIYDLNNMLIADFSTFNFKDGILYSTEIWEDAVNEGVEMNDIGFTGIDNGIISFQKDRITNEEFIELLTESKYLIEEGDMRLFLTPITGNTQQYDYPTEYIESEKEKYIAFKGGFYQGFFKLFGHQYQVLPSKFNNDLVFHFEVKPRTDYVENDRLVNYTHPDNKGIFFFMGTRAENKFWPFYKTDSALMETMKVERKQEDSEVIFLENEWVANEDDNSKFVENEYIGEGLDINTNIEKYNDSVGHAMNKHGYEEIVTDNKFLLFNRTETGYTIDKWEEGIEGVFIERKNWDNINYFPILNRTETGYTKDTINQYNEANEYNYDIFKDIRDNVFALRITEKGEIGYRYGILNCELDNKYEVIEEYSKPNIISFDSWNSINVRFAILNPTDKCNNTTRRMKIMIYVNGFLVFISKPLDAFNFKELNDVYQKQETVPYNISLGGGSLGLLETISPDYYLISEYMLPIEKDFCGTFMGDIKSFKIYNGFIDFNSIHKFLS